MSLSVVLAILISGFFTGALARLAIPGPDPMPIWLTVAIGLAGSIVGAVVGKAISHDNGFVISFLSFGFAMALVASYRRFVQRRPIFGPGALAFPDRGLGVDQTRERLQKLGVDPNAMGLGAAGLGAAGLGGIRGGPDPARLERSHLDAMLRELHRAGVLSDDELAAKLVGLQPDGEEKERP
jgi:uncharacterized membrane protein YeaQ/YmgE (transglycosylase-associated protein family)